MTKASDLFIQCLEEEGVEYIFGVPGEENLDLMDALLDSPIQFVTCRHEQGAAFMADVYGRLTGRARRPLTRTYLERTTGFEPATLTLAR